MRGLMYILAGLLVGLGSQIAVVWAAVLLARSPVLDRFPSLGPGSVGDLILLLILVLAMDVVLAGVLTLILRRRRKSMVLVLSTLTISAVIAMVVVLGFALA